RKEIIMPAGNPVLRIALVLVGAVLSGSLAEAANWPRFRGPNGTGVATDKGVPVQWDEKAGILWKVELPGLGNSSPVVWEDRLFVQAVPKDGKERLLVCIAVKDGKILWSRSITGKSSHTHVKNTLASSSPATDGERVYASFWDGDDIQMVA